MRSMFRNKLTKKSTSAAAVAGSCAAADDQEHAQQQQQQPSSSLRHRDRDRDGGFLDASLGGSGGGGSGGIDDSIRLNDGNATSSSSSSSAVGGGGDIMLPPSSSSRQKKKVTNNSNNSSTNSSLRSSKSSSGQSSSAMSITTTTNPGASGNSGGNSGGGGVLPSNYRRGAIRASAFALDDKSYDPNSIHNRSPNSITPKDEASRLLIYNAIKDNILFRSSSSNNQQHSPGSSNNSSSSSSNSNNYLAIRSTGETDEEQFHELIDAFTLRNCYPGEIVIAEGAQGDGFYVLSRGVVEVYESSEFRGRLYPGTGFGEIALLYGCPRTATVRAASSACEDETMEKGSCGSGSSSSSRGGGGGAGGAAAGGCELWFMDRRAFRAIMARHKRKRLNMKLMLLEKVKIHDKTLGEILQPHEINSIAMAAKFQEYRPGQIIVRQGDVGDAFYMVERGCVDVYIRDQYHPDGGHQQRPVVTLKAGDFFGEKALLSSDVRTATCVASSSPPPQSNEDGKNQRDGSSSGSSSDGGVKCLLLMREDFVRMLGDLEYLLDRSYEMRDGSDRLSLTSGSVGVGVGRWKEDGLVHPMGEKFEKNDFDIKRTLGVGAYGFVKLVQWKRAPPSQSNVYYALKCVSKQNIEEKKQQKKIKREEDIMRSLIHPFIARCYNVLEDAKGKYFLMEALCGGELCELLYYEGTFSEEWSMFYSASVLSAFAYMHERKVAYRDLKPENLVLDDVGYVKIVDFGLAKVIKNGHTYTFCGTPDYLAPEVILSEGHDWAVDYWGLGVLIYEMMEGSAPFCADNPMDTYRKALSGHVHIPDHFSVVVANLIKKLLHTDQSKRLGRTVGGSTAVMFHRWYTNFDWDALLDYRMEAPHVPELKDPNHSSTCDDEVVEGFASNFL